MSAELEIVRAFKDGFPTMPQGQASDHLRYECELATQHIDASLLPPISSRFVQETYEQWDQYYEDHEDKLGYLASWIHTTIRQLPAGVDLARDVDGGGFTDDKIIPTLFTSWVDLGNSTHVRFSQARTAMHNTMLTTKGIARGGALRSPVMRGVVLEATNEPTSLDPRNAVSLAVYEFAREEDARYPWANVGPGRIFDFTRFRDRPYTVGPLYSGHPHEVTNTADLDKASKAAVNVLKATFELTG